MPIQLSPTFPSDLKTNDSHPLCQGNFHRLLEASAVVGEATGWQPLHFIAKEQDQELGKEQGQAQTHPTAILPGYLKAHSYGEFIFDWDWARYYEQLKIPYYPKLLHALPLTPVNAPKILSSHQVHTQELFQASFDFYQAQPISSEHYHFIDEHEAHMLKAMGFHLMHSTQYHWQKNWESFEHYLSELSLNRRKFIKKERKRINQSALEIKMLKAQDCTPAIMQRVYELYLSTIDKKNSQAYLNQQFFQKLPEFMPESLMIFGAYQAGQLIAMSLFFYGNQALYGRYWGVDPQVEHLYPGLHFELCYYRGMDYCFEHDIELFEAGAQGEHKLWRGFYPVTIYSAHHLKLPALYQAVGKYIEQVNEHQRRELRELRKLLPYKDQEK